MSKNSNTNYLNLFGFTHTKYLSYLTTLDMSTALADDESPDEAGPSYKPPTHSSSLDTHELDTELPKPTIFTNIRLNDSGI